MRKPSPCPRKLLAQALQIDLDLAELPKLPKLRLEDSDRLTDDHIEYAAEAVKLCFDFPSGNSGGRDLYALLKVYLRDPVARAEINDVICAARARVVHSHQST